MYDVPLRCITALTQLTRLDIKIIYGSHVLNPEGDLQDEMNDERLSLRDIATNLRHLSSLSFNAPASFAATLAPLSNMTQLQVWLTRSELPPWQL